MGRMIRHQQQPQQHQQHPQNQQQQQEVEYNSMMMTRTMTTATEVAAAAATTATATATATAATTTTTTTAMLSKSTIQRRIDEGSLVLKLYSLLVPLVSSFRNEQQQQQQPKQQQLATFVAPRRKPQHYHFFVRQLVLLLLWIPSLLITTTTTSIVVTAQSSSSSSTSCSSYAMQLQMKGKKFFRTTDGLYVPLKGINYYPRPNVGVYTTSNSNDFYTEEFRSIWERDITYFQQLNINAVRIYAVDPSKNHDAFMCTLKSLGMYVIIGLGADCLDCAVTGDDAPTCYPEHLRERGEYIIQQFARYDNIIGFDAGNEVSLSAGNEYSNGPCQKQFLRDMRAYVSNCMSQNTIRHIPIGVAVADVDRSIKALYYNCLSDPTDELESAQYLGINVYLHCTGNLQSYKDIVGFNTLLDDFTNFSLNIPVLLTEFGCISDSFPAATDGSGYQAQRDFLQVDALFADEFETEFAGGFAFEYNTELVNSVSPYPFTTYAPGNFGIGYLSPSDCDDANITCAYNPFPQFDTLSSRYAAVNMNKGLYMNDYTPPDRTYPTCPSGFAKQSDFTWPGPTDITCPEDLTVICPNLPPECNTPTYPTSTSGSQPTAPAPRPKPVSSPVTSRPIKPPVTGPASSPTTTTSDGTDEPTIHHDIKNGYNDDEEVDTPIPTPSVTTLYPTIADLNVLNITDSAAATSIAALPYYYYYVIGATVPVLFTISYC